MAGATNPLASHPRISKRNPLADLLEAGADAATVIPDDVVVVRGGETYGHQAGKVISAQMAPDIAEAASEVPHGMIRSAKVGEIRLAGGTVELVPEAAWEGGPINTWHVNVTERARPVFPTKSVANPVPKKDRLRPP